MTTKQMREFMLWLRKERITYTTLTMGTVTLDGVVDGKHASPPIKQEPRKSYFDAQVEALEKLAANPTDSVPDEAKLDD